MAAIVLVHGAFHGGWCWHEVARQLRADGHEVYAPSLTGLADRSHLLSAEVGLETHILDIVNLVEWEGLEDVVLVAHSYGGLPVTGAADRIADKLKGLVYLDAFTPDDGVSGFEVRSGGAVAMELKITEDGLAMVPPPAEVFGLPADLAALADRRLTPHPVATMRDTIHLTGAWRRAPRKLYIRCTDYTAHYFDRYYEAAAADPGWVAIRRESIHNLMMTEPDWFVAQMREHVL